MSTFGLKDLRSRDRLLAVGKDITDEIKSDDVPSLAAAVAFKIMLALFPALAAAIGIFGLRTETSELERLLDTLSPPAPAGIVEFLQGPLDRLVNSPAAGFATFAGFAGGLWAASSAALTLNKALSRAYDVGHDRKFVSARVFALAVTAALLLALIGIFVLIVTGGAIENRVLESLPLTDTARGLFDLLSTVARYLLAAGALMLLIAFIYWIGPDYDERPPYTWISPGAVLGVVTWLVASGLFALYAGSRFASFGENSVYGPLGSAILFMLWLQLTMLAVLLGAEVNQVLRLHAGRRTDQAEVAGFGGEPMGELPNTPDAARRAVDELRPATSVGGMQDRARQPSETPARSASMATVVGAVVAVASGLAGAIGLLRNLRRD